MEALGAASSVFAVVSLAIQLGSNIQRLIDFWDSVKGAPAEVEQIKCHLRVLGELLRSIELDTRTDTDAATSVIGIECLRICLRSFGKIDNITKELDKGLNGNGIRRRWTCLRKAQRDKEMTAYWHEFERAKSMLMLYQGWQHGKRHDLMLGILNKMANAVQFEKPMESLREARDVEVIQQPCGHYQSTRTQLGSSTHELRLSFGVFHVRIVTYLIRGKSSRATGIEFSRGTRQKQIIATFTPGFFKFPILEWRLTQSYDASWKAGFQSLNLRPGWSPIFKYSALGDIQNVQRLIEAGLASPNDVNTDGWTVLHCAAAGHHAELCGMLIDIGAVTDAVTERYDTPLLLAIKKVPLGSRWENRRQSRGEADSINTVRILVEHGQNDPMQSDDIGFNSVISAARESCTKTLSWVLNQEEYVIDLWYKTPGGITASACVTTREDFSSDILTPFFGKGIKPSSACVDDWYFRFGPKLPRLEAPSMLQYSVWIWYDKLLNTDETWLNTSDSWSGAWRNDIWSDRLKTPPSPLATIKALLDQGADLHAQSVSGHTILDGLCLNLVHLDGCARRPQHLAACMETWLHLLRDLDFKVRDYIRRERALHENVVLDLGLSLHMELRFDENAPPWIWSVFQGPEERDQQVYVDRIDKCAIWPEWHRTYTLPEQIPPHTPAKLLSANIKIVILQRYEDPSQIHLEYSHTDGFIPSTVAPPSSLNLVWKMKELLYLATRLRYEFSFYVALVLSFLGCGYFARLWGTAMFFALLKFFEEPVLR